MVSGAIRFCWRTSLVPNIARSEVTPRMRAMFSARSIWRLIQKMRSATRDSISGDDPSVFGSAALRRVDYQRAFLERDAGQSAGNELDFFAREYERAQVDVARRDAAFDPGGTGRERQRRLRDVG